MAQQRPVHELVDRPERGRVLSDQRRGQLADAGPRAGPERRQVERSQWTDFAVTREAVVGEQLDDRTVEYLDVLALGPRITPLDQGQVHLINPNSGNFHGPSFFRAVARAETILTDYLGTDQVGARPASCW